MRGINLSHPLQTSLKQEDDLVVYHEILRCVRILHVDAVVGIRNIMVERDAMNRGTSTLPLVLPKNLLHFSRAQFGDLIVAQRLRLLESYTEHQLVDLENEFKAFKAQVNREPHFCQMIEVMDDNVSFDEAWSMIGARYPLLCALFGGLASVFPGTSTVESDFSVIGYEKDDYRSALTNFSLEGILQCKQFILMSKINAIIS